MESGIRKILPLEDVMDSFHDLFVNIVFCEKSVEGINKRIDNCNEDSYVFNNQSRYYLESISQDMIVSVSILIKYGYGGH